MLCVVTFYKFVVLTDPQSMRDRIESFCRDQGVMGTILIAPEGINSTIAGTADAIDRTLAFLRSHGEFADMTHKTSHAATMPFRKLKVRVKKEIVTMKAPVDPANLVGRYVNAKDWNELIARDGVIVIDTRNSYEFAEGTFEGAVDPKTDIFSQFPDYVRDNLDGCKNRPIAMFCTGGIRCEKATSYLLQQGFNEVYHLQGGILKYLEEIPKDQSKWQGECFVFDERRALGHGLEIKTDQS